MTRATAHKKRYRIEMMGDGTFYNFIDQIFDEFDEQTCENCRWYDSETTDSILPTTMWFCNNKESMAYNRSVSPKPDDGCNKFEPK